MSDQAGRDDCCAADVDPRIARHFDGEMAAHDEAGTLPPMKQVSQRLLTLLSDVGEARPTLLELGCGSGALTVALLESGAVSADGVDLSPGSLSVARRRAAEAGVAERVSFQLGDASRAQVEPHDWVVLDRVICCFGEVDQLLANSMGVAGRRYVFSVPHSRGWRGAVNHAIRAAENLTNRWRGRPCPGYTHSVPMIERRIADAGFRRLRSTTIGLWYAAVWERAQPADG